MRKRTQRTRLTRELGPTSTQHLLQALPTAQQRSLHRQLLPRRCRPAEHHWRIDACIPMNIADTDGWVEVLLIRVCRVCGHTEAWSGEQSLRDRQLRLYGAEPVP